jgi:hypothetical protein
MQTVSSSESRMIETRRKDGVGRRRDYIGTPGEIIEGPQGFLVERPYAGARIDPHFHDIDQFQVIVAGDGRMGKKPVKPITFQYADAYTPYGPIVADDDGISFFTLRNVASGGHFSMPGSRHLMPCRAGRNIAGGIDLDGDVLAENAVSRESLMESQNDGVHAESIHLGPNASAPGVPCEGGGQYYLVCDGTLVENGKTLDELSLMHVGADEDVPTLQAGPEGATVLAMQFGRPSERPGSDPSKLTGRDPDAYVLKTEKP